MKKTLIVLLVACTFPSLVISAERNVSADSETGGSKVVSSVSDSTEKPRLINLIKWLEVAVLTQHLLIAAKI